MRHRIKLAGVLALTLCLAALSNASAATAGADNSAAEVENAQSICVSSDAIPSADRVIERDNMNIQPPDVSGSSGNEGCSSVVVYMEAAEGRANKPFDFGEDMKTELRETAQDKLGIDMNDYQYVSMSDALTDSTYQDTVPGQILCTAFMELEEGDYLPYGIFYDNDTAYVIQRIDNESHQLIEYRIQENNPVSKNKADENSMYPSIPYEITNILTW